MNKPIAVELCGKTYKMVRLSCMQIIDIAEQYVRDSMLKTIEAAATLISEGERTAFISSELDRIPTGVELEAKARPLLDGKKMPDEIAYRMLHESIRVHQPELSFDDAVNLYNDAESEEMMHAFRVAAGKVDARASTSSKRSRGRTGGRRKK